MTPRNNIDIAQIESREPNESKKELNIRRPQGYGLLALPNGNIIEYEIPKCQKGDKSHVKRLDSMFNNIANLTQNENSKSRISSLKRNASDFKDKDMLSRNFTNNGFLCSIKEDHDRENSASSLLMNKPIRSLRDVYMGIKKDYNKRKKQKETAKLEETKKLSETKSQSSYDDSYDS